MRCMRALAARRLVQIQSMHDESGGSMVHSLKRLREEGRIVEGMLPKARAIENALRGGVRRVHVVSYKSPEGILGEVFTNEGTGTLVVADVNALSPAELTASG